MKTVALVSYRHEFLESLPQRISLLNSPATPVYLLCKVLSVLKTKKKSYGKEVNVVRFDRMSVCVPRSRNTCSAPQTAENVCTPPNTRLDFVKNPKCRSKSYSEEWMFESSLLNSHWFRLTVKSSRVCLRPMPTHAEKSGRCHMTKPGQYGDWKPVNAGLCGEVVSWCLAPSGKRDSNADLERKTWDFLTFSKMEFWVLLWKKFISLGSSGAPVWLLEKVERKALAYELCLSDWAASKISNQRL